MRTRARSVAVGALAAALAAGALPAAGREAPPAPGGPAVQRQARRAAKPPAGRPEPTPEQRSALSLLDSLADQARSIEDGPTRVMVLTRLADALSARDRERSRRLYRTAFDAVDDIDESTDGSGAPLGTRTQLRAEILESLYRTDPEYAAKLTRALDDDLDSIESFGMPFPTGSERGAALLRAAALLAPSNPGLAADLGRQGLTHGVPFEFSGLLAALGKSDRRLADMLAAEAVEAASRHAATPVDLWGVAAYVFPALGGAAVEAQATQEFGPNPELARSFLEVAHAVTARFAAEAVVASATPDGASDPLAAQEVSGGYAIASQLAPYFDRYAPERSAAFRAALGQLERLLPADYIARYEALADERDPDALVARAEAEPNAELKNAYYARAAFAAVARGDYRLARSILERVTDEATRESLMTPLATQAAIQAVDRRRFDEARKIALDVPDLESRATVYTRIALSAAGEDDRQRAAEALDDAARLLLKAGTVATPEKAAALVHVANTYATVDATRAFEVMETAIDTVNKARRRQEAADADRRSPGERPQPALGFHLQLGRHDASQGLARLAAADFFRALSLAQSYEDRSLSILAQLAVARAVLRAAPARPAEPPAEAAAPAGKPAKKGAAGPAKKAAGGPPAVAAEGGAG